MSPVLNAILLSEIINFVEVIKMKKIISSCVAIILSISSLSALTACTNKDMGTVGGAAVGGVAGNLLTGGSAVGTAVGAVGGGIIGNQATK